MQRFVFALVLLAIVPSLALADVLGVRAAPRGEGLRLVIDLSEPSKFRAFELSEPPRVVVDLPKLAWLTNRLPDKVQGLAGVRYGLFRANAYRLVFDLERSAAIASANLIPGQQGQGKRLVIDLEYGAKLKGQQFGTFSPLKTSPPPPKPKKEWVVMIDAGHGGIDPGTIGVGRVREKHVNLAVAKKLKKILDSKPGYNVLLTRTKDEFLRLRERVRIGRASRADLFISIHADAHPDPSVSGASIYTLSEKGSDKEAERLAKSENAADLLGGAPLEEDNQEVASILIDLAQRETKNQSMAVADDILFALAPTQPLLRRPKRSAGFAVLKAPDVPSVLIELGFLTNKTDAQRLSRKKNQEAIARAIAAGIVRYFEGANTARSRQNPK
jgi:N-acetylmuramoyl-L-alanine amidase